MITAFLAIAVFLSALCIDAANVRYVMAVERRDGHRAALWSCLQWGASLVGFLVAIKVTLWMLPLELAGLYFGCLLSMKQPSTVKSQ
jgi:hypothetical protein